MVALAWAVICAASLRVAYPSANEPPLLKYLGVEGIADERGFYVDASDKRNPVTVQDYHRWWGAEQGQALRRAADRKERSLQFFRSPVAVPLSADIPARAGATFPAVGMYGFAAGRDAYVGEIFGLGDPLSARLRLSTRTRPGHEKVLEPAWFAARLGADDASVPPKLYRSRVSASRPSVGSMSTLAKLLSAVQGELTMGRALSNLFMSWKLTRLRFQ
ncbi:MAG TPA: hypothetical protein VK988_13925 [Acidimicrobiales bacterium]|nr:hypothetical protein [Acidimicrobiales bacterium]